MALSDWVAKSRVRVADYGLFGAYASLQEAGIDAARRVGRRLPVGTNVFDREWELLVLLDGCRTDALRTALDGRDIDYRWDTLWSVGSQSVEWTNNTFTEEYRAEMARTAYVTANPYSSNILDGEAFALFDDVWGYGVDPELSTVPPDVVTDRAVQARRAGGFDRLIVHYMQPHAPFIGASADRVVLTSNPEGTHSTSDDPLNRDIWWNKLKYGELPRETVWTAYMATLELALDSVETLLHNVDADPAVISADHGNAFGELGAYGHPSGLPFPAVRRVPWARTTAVDSGTYEPSVEATTDGEREAEREELLRNLGYVD